MKQREFHPYAAIFDLLEGPKLDELAASIRKGYRKERPIILHPDGRIIDGRNRYIACQRAGVEPLYETWDGKGSLVDLIMALNRHRRHDTDGARSMQAARALPFYEEEARGRQAAAGGDRRSVGATVPEAIDGKRARDDAAKAFDVSPRSVQSAKKVLTNGVPELQAAVSSGAVGVAPAAEVAKLPPERQREVVAEGPASVTRAAKTVREERKAAPADATTQPAAPDDSRGRTGNAAIVAIRKAMRSLDEASDQLSGDWPGFEETCADLSERAHALTVEIERAIKAAR